MRSNHLDISSEAIRLWECVEAAGPWPFVTRRVFHDAERSAHVWVSRAHRKRLSGDITSARWQELPRWLWAPHDINWWIGSLFALGALLFVLGGVFGLTPGLVRWFGMRPSQVNCLYFAGSVPFTLAAYLQLFQAANAPENYTPGAPAPAKRRFFGWCPREAGWLSCALQFPGTILFNFNTFDAMIPGLTWFQQDLAVWAPNFLGSVLFLASGYLAFIETCHAHWAWKPSSLSWWVTFINLLGCIGFMGGAVCSFVPSGAPNESLVLFSGVFTVLGASCFFAGACLLLPEAGDS